jgi:hypothetical protein
MHADCVGARFQRALCTLNDVVKDQVIDNAPRRLPPLLDLTPLVVNPLDDTA